MFLFHQVVNEVGGVSSAACTAFLSELEEWNEEIGVVYGTNNQPSRAVLFPIHGLINSSAVLQFIESKFLFQFTKSMLSISIILLGNSISKFQIFFFYIAGSLMLIISF